VDVERVTRLLSVLLSAIIPNAEFRVSSDGRIDVRGDAVVSFTFDAFFATG